jgi:hypothetical protein
MVGQRDAWNESEVSKSVLKLATREQILAWSLRGMEMGGHGQVRFSRFDGRTPNAIALS